MRIPMLLIGTGMHRSAGFKKRNRSRICLIGGIRAAWLTAASIDRALEEMLFREIRTLVREGGLILTSTCGLHHPAFLPNIKRLYRSVQGFDDSTNL